MIDYHMHSDFSADGKQTIEDIGNTAEAMGLKEIAITDHSDLEYPYDMTFAFDFEARAKVIQNEREKHPNLKIRDAIEIGIMPETKQDYVNLIESYPFDFVILSIHVIDGVDPYYHTYFEGRSREDAFRAYLEAILQSVTDFKSYSVVGHIGYAARFADGDNRSIQYEDFPELIDAILKTVIKNGKGIEVNTKGISTVGETLPSRSILARYYELGGEIITVGSDAHVSERIGDRVLETIQMLKNIGFKSITTFEKQKPIQIEI